MSDNKITVGPVRFSYAHVWKPFKSDNGEEKYMVNLIIDKDDTALVKKIKRAIQAAADSEKGQKLLKGKKNWDNPLRDGDVKREGDGAYENCYYLNAKSERQPGIVDSKREEILDQREFYSGCHGYASITFFPYNNKGNTGVGVGLNHVMKTKDDDPLAGGGSAKQAFEGIEIEDDENDEDGSEFF